ncbi:MAG: hypothetical protein JWN72_1525 [Thermoleophilia bacterium]|nr:hypothetical protein [Thermoleophilia bacterium]
MIVRILGEGQFELPESELDTLNELDATLTAAVQEGDTETFERSLGDLLGRVRDGGTSCSDEFLGESTFVLPAADSTLEEVSALLADDGLVPG